MTEKTHTVVLAEDDAGYLFPISAILSDAGFAVVEVSDGPGLLETWRSADVLVVDVRLPTGGTYEGINVARQIRERADGAQKPVIFISELSEASCEDALVEFPGRYVWLQKPLDGDLLLSAIEDAQRQSFTS